MGRHRRIRRAIPYALAAMMWLASTLGAAGGLRAAVDLLLDCATVCVTVWALLCVYSGGLPRQNRARLDDYDRAWAQVYPESQARERRAAMRVADG